MAKCPRADWNQDLLDIAEEYLRPVLDNLCDTESKALQEEMTQPVVDLLEQMGSDIRACLDSNQHGAFREYFENMQKYEKDIEVTLKLACKKYGSEVQHIVFNAMTNSNTNPFVKKMQTIYGLAYHATKTKHNHRLHSARTHVFDSTLLVPRLGPYMGLKEYLESLIEVRLQEVESKLLEKCDTVFGNVLHDFENMCPRRPDDTTGATKRRYALGKVVEKAKATFNTEVKSKLLECGLKVH
ncbi:uncharacterized protein M421DRAFT_96727 [Didymella exigua CBS 183.55]|uniref:DUF7605 domain-containing protein n=1 Tax=Didymella exigua CBS 183.55 TaxID=1150837 RepID=A0A6A5R5V0_9PLEO|nr:uncharacterized protein M421DRAFT_96727 [Didymella exigua CBS 183.55]KAF1922570.1 hypothetical protein M421DRAFT_96727 [Didymella exigua CBS 183.55]